MRQHRRRPPDDMRQQANGRPCSWGRGAAKFTPIYSYLCIFYGAFTGYLLGSVVFAAYFGVFLPKFGPFFARFWSANARNSRDLSTRRQLCDMCQQTNGRPCGTFLEIPRRFRGVARILFANALHSGRLRALAGQISRAVCSCPRVFARVGVHGFCTEMYGFCTVSVRFCTEKRRKTGQKRPRESRTGGRRASALPHRTPGLQVGCRTRTID